MKDEFINDNMIIYVKREINTNISYEYIIHDFISLYYVKKYFKFLRYSV